MFMLNFYQHFSIVQRRNFFHWINIIFNSLDVDRRKIVGPERSCAEWLLRNGAKIKCAKSNKIITNYNLLPDEKDTNAILIEEVDATDSSISHYGFCHFKGCNHIQKLILKNCLYIEDEALKELSYLKNCLRYLEIYNCKNITHNGLLHLVDLNKLNELHLLKLPYVKDKMIFEKLKEKMPSCQINFQI